MFLFENPDDMSLFVRRVREELKLSINVARVPNRALESFQPPLNINHIKKFGFATYLREQIEAPEAILIYLCLYNNIHQVPIGNADTHKNIREVLRQIPELNRIYTNTHMYSSTKSRYTGSISSSSSEIQNSFWLTSSVNQNDLKLREEEANKIQLKLREVDAKLKNTFDQKAIIEKGLEGLKSELSKVNERRYHIENLGKKLMTKQKMLKTLEEQNIDLFAEAKKKLTKMNDLAKRKAKIFVDCVEQAKSLVNQNKDKINAVYMYAMYQAEKIKMESELREYVIKKQELESNIENYQANLKNAKDNAKSALDEANKINQTSLENGIPANYKTHFATLPETIDKIEMDITQSEAIQQCSSNIDESIVKEFEQRSKLIEALKQDFEKKKNKLLNHQTDYENIKNDWMDRVETMISAINLKFSALFLQLKCAGEVSLGRPDNLEEFAKYGICIKVSFRNDEQLQELTAWQQSGGEKSVSTMMYMIALQEMTKCPFRVVDEINQVGRYFYIFS